MQQRTVIWLIILRVVVITTLLLTALMFQSVTEFTRSITVFFYLTAFTYALTILFITLLKFTPPLLHVYFQLVGDLFIITGIVYYSGGLESSFSFLYIISIIIASTLLYRRGGMIIASVASIAYGAMIDLQYYGFLTFLPFSIDVPVWSQGKIYYNLFINIVGFFAAAFLTSIISEKLRATTEVLSATTSHLHDLQVFQHSILTSITAPLLISNEKGLIQYMNPAAREVFPEITQITSLGIISLEQLTDLSPKETFRFEKPYRQDERVYLPSISRFHASDGSAKGYILIFDDITELHNLETELRQKEHIAAIGTMASAIAHEIRNPLATITGSVQMLESDAHEGPDSRLFGIILEESRRLNRFIESFIRFVKSPEPEFEELDLKNQMEEFIHLLNSDIEWSNITFTLAAPADPLFIFGDRDRIQQIFWNIITNAQKAIGKESGTIKITMEELEKTVRVSMKDSGTGITEKEREKIFDPFRGGFTRGLGLGLTLVRRYMEDNRGSIEISREEGGGAEFILHFLKQEVSDL